MARGEGQISNSKLKTQNSKLKTQNSKLKTQNSKLKTQNLTLPTSTYPNKSEKSSRVKLSAGVDGDGAETGAAIAAPSQLMAAKNLLTLRSRLRGASEYWDVTSPTCWISGGRSSQFRVLKNS
jgi:hypothetical protein